MNRLRYFIVLGLLILIQQKAVGQSCNPPPLAGFYFVDNGVGCAPLATRIETLFSDLNAGSEITVDWGDGSAPDTFITTATQMNTTFTHNYPSNFMICEYTVTATAVKNCADRASATFSSEVTVWDDDQTGMDVSGPFYVCQGFSTNIRFTDNSAWNCFPGTGLPNNDPRTLQWLYGTGGTSMQGATVSGSNVPPVFTGAQYTANNPGTQSLNVNIPATRPDGSAHNIGDRFYITLNNWNYCNPQPMAPVTGRSYIEIIAPPSPIFETKLTDASGPTRTSFCPGDVVHFDNDTPNLNGNTYVWQIYDDATGTNLIHTSYNTNPSFSFANSGTKLIRLNASPRGVIGNCNVSYESTIDIVDVPRADIQINAQAFDDDLIQFCEDTTLPSGYSVTFNNVSTGFTANTEFYLDFYDENDVRFLFFASNFSTLTAKTVDFANPGIHKVVLRAVDPITTCETVDTAYVEIYSRPTADFNIIGSTDICLGKQVDFEDTSINFTTNWSGIPGDTITVWKWWFDYNGDPLSTPDAIISSGDNGDISHTFNTAGNYDVRLQVSKPFTNVCEIDHIVNVNVYDNPNATFTPDITEGCPDLPVTMTNTSFPQPTGITVDYRWILTDVFTGVRDTINYADPTADTTFVFTHARGDNLNHQYQVQMEAVSNIGCKTYSPIETITVYPAPNSGFTSDFDVFALNCSPVPVNFNVDAATLAIPNISQFRWTINDGNGNVNSFTRPVSDPSFSHTFTNATNTIINYEVTLEVELSVVGCVVPFRQTIRSNPNPTSAFTISEVDRNCEFITVNIDATDKGLAVYDWSVSTTAANSPVFDDNFNLVFDRPSAIAGDLTLTMTLRTENLLGCESPTVTTQTFVIDHQDDVSVALNMLGSGTVCNEVNAQFENNTATYPPGTTWELFVTEGSGIPINVTAEVTGNLDAGGSFSYAFTNDGAYLVELVASTPDGCTFKDDATITVFPDVTAVFNPNVTEGCGPLEVVFNENSFNQPDIQTKFWTIENITAGSTLYARQSALLPGYILPNTTNAPIDYAITLDIVSFNNCVDDTTIVVTVYPEVSSSFIVTGPNPSCEPYEVSFENTSNNPIGTTYTWDWGDGTFTSVTDTDPGYSTTISHTFSNSSYFADNIVTVRLTTMSPDNCVISSTNQVTLHPLVDASIVADKTIGCAPLTVNFENASLGNINPGSAWYVTDITTGVRTMISEDVFINHTFENTSSSDKQFLVEYEAINLGGCIDVASATITVHPEIQSVFSFSGSNEACSPYPVTFTNEAIRDGVTYIWNWGDGTPNDTTRLENQIVHIFENFSTSLQKNFNIILTAVNETTGCEVASSDVITIYPTIVTDVVPDIPEGCGPVRVNFTNNSAGVGLVHTWYYRVKGTTERLGIQNTAFVSYELGNMTPDDIVYEVVYEVENPNGCVGTESFDITVFPEIEAMFDADPIKQIMPNKTVTVSNLSTPGNWEYTWDFGDGIGTSNEQNPGPYEYENYGDYLITLTVRNPLRGCESEHAVLIQIEPATPQIDFSYDPENGCLPVVVNFTNLSTGADPTTYEWDFGDGIGFSNEVNPTYRYYRPGVYTVKLSATNALGLRVTEIKEEIIEVYDIPRASFVSRPSIVYLPDAPVVVQNYTVGAVDYHWDFGDGTTYNEYEPRHFYQEEGEYFIELIAISENNCTDTLRVESAVTAINGGQVKIPNAFTPSLDGPPNQGSLGFASNDVFLPVVEGVVEFKMEIFNRWGEMLFSTNNQNIGWDGYFNGRLSPQGVYLFKLQMKFISGESTTRVGDVTLIR